jgi:hypothetical protein
MKFQRLIFGLSIASLTFTGVSPSWALPQTGGEVLMAQPVEPTECTRALVRDTSPLNVRNEPNGPTILGRYPDGSGVRIEKYARDSQDRIWALVYPDSREMKNPPPQGWVFAAKLMCPRDGLPASETFPARRSSRFKK